jgi:hypothetical protein
MIVVANAADTSCYRVRRGSKKTLRKHTNIE